MTEIVSRKALAAALLVVACAPAGPAPAPAPADPPPAGERERPDRVAEAVAPILLGVVVPRSGSPVLERYAALVLEGAELAAARYEQRTGRTVRLLVRDDRGEVGRAADLVRRLEEEGAVGVIGPLRSEALDSAAAARVGAGFPLVSPTASEHPAPGSNAWTLNAADGLAPSVLAEFAVGMGHTRLATLFPAGADGERLAREFEASARRRGGAVVASVMYPPGTTTFSAQVEELHAAVPHAIYIPAAPDDVPQIAPQIRYSDLGDTGVIMLGGEAWAAPGILRTVEASALEGVVAAVPMHESAADHGWPEFVELYERTNRRTLENPFPALGFDAAELLLAALDRSGVPSPVMLGEDGWHRGATGWLSARGGQVVRRPYLVRIELGRTVLMGSRGGEVRR